jgi:hypothetical protein
MLHLTKILYALKIHLNLQLAYLTDSTGDHPHSVSPTLQQIINILPSSVQFIQPEQKQNMYCSYMDGQLPLVNHDQAVKREKIQSVYRTWGHVCLLQSFIKQFVTIWVFWYLLIR